MLEQSYAKPIELVSLTNQYFKVLITYICNIYVIIKMFFPKELG